MVKKEFVEKVTFSVGLWYEWMGFLHRESPMEGNSLGREQFEWDYDYINYTDLDYGIPFLCHNFIWI